MPVYFIYYTIEIGTDVTDNIAMERCMKRFSERNGYSPTPSSDFEDMHPDLRNAIWNRIYKIINDNIYYAGYGSSTYISRDEVESLWAEFFNKNIREMPYAGEFTKVIDETYKKLKWFEIYDLIEWLVNRNDNYHRSKRTKEFNQILDQHNSPCRVVNGLIQEISNKELYEELTNCVEQAPNDIVRNHLKEAQILYSKREDTNFSQSCLESIKAVEACFHIYLENKDILGNNIRKLKKDKKLNQHIIEILTKINAFRGDDVAHADKVEGYVVTKFDAILIHILCVGFVDYLKSLNTGKN